MYDTELENRIVLSLDSFEPTWSNALFRKLRVNKTRYQKARDNMIEEGLIIAEKKGNNLLLKATNITDIGKQDWARITRINCETILNHLAERQPIFKVKKNKKFSIRKNEEDALNAFFHELDRKMIVYIRLVNADALGLITHHQAKFHQKQCLELVNEFIKKLLDEHKEFKEQIKEFAQSQVRTIQFKI